MSEGDTRRGAILGAFDEAIEEGGFSTPGYEVLEELDRGGMAVVYRARQLLPEREVALKVMLPRFAGLEDICERFQREARAMAALDHPGVLPVYQVGESDGMAFLTMKLARGGTLQARLAEGLPKVKEAVDWLRKVGEAVHFAHQRGVLHRDLKPGNLLFDEEGTIYVGDFGVAKLEFAGDGGLTMTNAVVGTPHYLAPEVASGETNSGSVASDLYGLGAILYECLTGKRPHDGAENLAAQLRRVADDEVVPIRKVRSDISSDLAVICEKALSKNPDDRYESVAAFVEDLTRWSEGREISARPASLPEKIWKWAKRHPLPASLTAALMLMLIAGIFLQLNNTWRQRERLRESLLERARFERVVGQPGFRERTLELLQESKELGKAPQIREEAVAVLSRWDVAKGESLWGEDHRERQFQLMPREGGFGVVSRETGELHWEIAGGVLRCPEAWSSDGRFLAIAEGERMGVSIYDVRSRKLFATLATRSWPEKMIFRPEGEELALQFADGLLSYVTVEGEWLVEVSPPDFGPVAPTGFWKWQGQALAPGEATLCCGRISPDGRLIATSSSLGVQIWDVEARRAVDFHPVGNQRIDAVTSSWWLSERELLIQVPGGLERMLLTEDGEVTLVGELQRVPGTKVLEVTAAGDWVMEVLDEDGVKSWERWEQGDVEKATVLEGKPEVEKSGVEGGRAMVVGDWVLPLPAGEVARDFYVLNKEKRVIVLTNNYRIFDWDLPVLEDALKRNGL